MGHRRGQAVKNRGVAEIWGHDQAGTWPRTGNAVKKGVCLRRGAKAASSLCSLTEIGSSLTRYNALTCPSCVSHIFLFSRPPTTMASVSSPRRLRRERIEIPIPTRKRFGPGTAPTQPRLSLLPAHDSTAVILDKVLCTEGSGKRARLQLCYTITWTDSPSKRATISCAKALEYVSRREMDHSRYRSWHQGTRLAKRLSPHGRPICGPGRRSR